MLEKQRMALSRRRRLKALRWADFAVADARGGDVVSLAAYLGGTGQREAAEPWPRCSGSASAMADDSMFAPLPAGKGTAGAVGAAVRPERAPIVPVPADAPQCAWRHPKHGAPVAMWPYHDADGRLVRYAARVEYHGAGGERKKDVLPITYCRIERCARVSLTPIASLSAAASAAAATASDETPAAWISRTTGKTLPANLARFAACP